MTVKGVTDRQDWFIDPSMSIKGKECTARIYIVSAFSGFIRSCVSVIKPSVLQPGSPITLLQSYMYSGFSFENVGPRPIQFTAYTSTKAALNWNLVFKNICVYMALGKYLEREFGVLR
jgi:hypothetical protein